MQGVELLAPARDLECGLAALSCGADALYVGPPAFGARQRAGNSIQDIARLAEAAHVYRARVYATVNTLLSDDELPVAVELLWKLHEAGVDAVIVQDMGLLECELPPIPLIASTQTHAMSGEQALFLERAGFSRIILPRELGFEEIRAIRAVCAAELEVFVHGSLCVSVSGQCWLSWVLGGRSGNRGECAQPCRLPWDLVDRDDRPIAQGRHLLSLMDMDRTEQLGVLLDLGVTSFKIEGRLKDRDYVRNVVSWYRQHLNPLLEPRGLQASSLGRSAPGFKPDPRRTFHRGSTPYLPGPDRARIWNFETPKSMGAPIGCVHALSPQGLLLDRDHDLIPGDGLCFLDEQGHLRGASVEVIQRGRVRLSRTEWPGPGAGVLLYRNRDLAFERTLNSARSERRIPIRIQARTELGTCLLRAVDPEGVEVEHRIEGLSRAERPEAALEVARAQLSRLGDTEFELSELDLDPNTIPFLPRSAWNEARRALLERLQKARALAWKEARSEVAHPRTTHSSPERRLDYRGNVLNEAARAFYQRHGVQEIEPAAEAGTALRGRPVMTARHCLKYAFGLCQRWPLPDGVLRARAEEPLSLVDARGLRFPLRFDCKTCIMEVLGPEGLTSKKEQPP